MGYDPLAQEADDGQKEIAEIMYLQQLVLPYHLGALGSSIRYGPLRGQESYYERVGRKDDLKVLLIWVRFTSFRYPRLGLANTNAGDGGLYRTLRLRNRVP